MEPFSDDPVPVHCPACGFEFTTVNHELQQLMVDLRTSAGREILSMKQVAEICGMSCKTIARALSDGHLRSSRTGERSPHMITIRDLAIWLLESRRGQ